MSETDGNRPIPDQRREMLMHLLHREPVLSVHQLTELLGVSHMTVRRDIEQLERAGRAISVPGGVRMANALKREPAFTVKSETDVEEKRAIASVAATWLHDAATVYVDAGTTTGALVDHVLTLRDATVVTNDFAIADRLAMAGYPDVVHIGGRVDTQNRSSVGLLAANTLRQLNIDVAFISTSSWDLARGITTPYESKVEVKRAALDSASKSVLLATSSKYGSFAMYDVAPLTRFNSIVTDWKFPGVAADAANELGIEIVVANESR